MGALEGNWALEQGGGSASGREQRQLKGTRRASEVIALTVTSHHFFSTMTQNSKLSSP